MPTSASRRRQPSTTVQLSISEVRTLIRIANHYLSVRPIRALIRVVAPAPMRARFRFIADESKWLKRFATSTQNAMKAAGEEKRDVVLTVPALVAFWGRLLASTNTPRSRRKLSGTALETREALAVKLEASIMTLLPRYRKEIEDQIQTRRPVEEVWMRRRLGLPARGGDTTSSDLDHPS